jgi:hypothetical protein
MHCSYCSAGGEIDKNDKSENHVENDKFENHVEPFEPDRLWRGPINDDGEEASFRQGELYATAISKRALVLTP